MIWDDTGFLLSKHRYNENSLITEIYTKNHGKISGLIFGGTSKKIKNYLQTGNELFLNYNSKSDNRIGYFKIEILKAYSPIYFDDSQKLNCIISSMHLIKLLTADSQTNTKIYNLINEFYSIISNDSWLQQYIYWELELLKILGYDLELRSKVNKKIINDEIFYVAESSTEKKFVPNFLVDKDISVKDHKTLINGLKLIGNYLEKTILKPNNINFPISRSQFISSLK